MKDKVLVVLLGVIMLSSILLGFEARPVWDEIINPRMSRTTMMTEPLNVQEQSMEMYLELVKFFKYNMTNIKRDLTDEELKEEGGVCSHYSEWYVKQAKDRGLMGKRVDMIGEETGHAIAIVWDPNLTQYCILDQITSPKCWGLGGIQDE